jgi:hypothetical protein
MLLKQSLYAEVAAPGSLMYQLDFSGPTFVLFTLSPRDMVFIFGVYYFMLK